MDSPETYNRTRQLEKPPSRDPIVIASIVLFIAIVAGVTAVILELLPQIQTLLGCLIALLMIPVLLRRKRPRHCLHCNSVLGYISRPMVLSAEYLAMGGVKKGDSYYAKCEWAHKHSPTDWAKITHRAQACHHCRVSKEGYEADYEPVSEREMHNLLSQQKIRARREKEQQQKL